MPSEKHIILSRKALIWLENKATQRGLRGCEEVILKTGYVCDAAAICGLQYQYYKNWIGDRKPNDLSDDFTWIFETKVSRSDFLKTFVHNNHGGSRLDSVCNFHFIVTPKKMLNESEVPEFWGLLEESGAGLKIVKQPEYIVQPISHLHEFGYTLLRSGNNRKFTYNLEVEPTKHFGSNLLWNEPRDLSKMTNEQQPERSVATKLLKERDAG